MARIPKLTLFSIIVCTQPYWEMFGLKKKVFHGCNRKSMLKKRAGMVLSFLTTYSLTGFYLNIMFDICILEELYIICCLISPLYSGSTKIYSNTWLKFSLWLPGQKFWCSVLTFCHLFLTGTSVMKVTASDADDPTYGNSARVVYSVEGQKFFKVDKDTGKDDQIFPTAECLFLFFCWCYSSISYAV